MANMLTAVYVVVAAILFVRFVLLVRRGIHAKTDSVVEIVAAIAIAIACVGLLLMSVTVCAVNGGCSGMNGQVLIYPLGAMLFLPWALPKLWRLAHRRHRS